MLWQIPLGEDAAAPSRAFRSGSSVRDLAEAHVEALLRPEAGAKRYLVASSEVFAFGLAAEIIRAEILNSQEAGRWSTKGLDKSGGIVDGETAARELGITYRNFGGTVVDLVKQAAAMP